MLFTDALTAPELSRPGKAGTELDTILRCVYTTK